MELLKLEVKGQAIEATNSTKSLGVYLDRNLTFQEEVQHIRRKMACGINPKIFSHENSSPAFECSRYQSPTLSGITFEWYIGNFF